MWVTAYTVGHVVLLALALVVARTRREHRPFVVWLTLLLAYAYADAQWITGLASMPRPYHGTARLMLHSAQFMYLAGGCAFVIAAGRAVGLRPRRASLAPLAVFAIAMFTLVLGYGGSRGPGLYQLGPLEFRSASVFTIAMACFTGLTWAGILPAVIGPRTAAIRASSITIASVTAVATFDVIRVALPFTWARASTWSVVPITQLGATLFAIGFHVAGLAGAWAKASAADHSELQFMSAAMARARLRLRFLRARLQGPIADAAYRHDPTLLYPITMTLARQLGSARLEDIVTLAHLSPQGSAALETVLVVTGSLPTSVASRLIAEIRQRLADERSEPAVATRAAASARIRPFVAAIEASLQRVPREMALDVARLAADLCAQASAARSEGIGPGSSNGGSLTT